MDTWREEEEEELVQDVQQARGIASGIVSARERQAQVLSDPADEHTHYLFSILNKGRWRHLSLPVSRDR